MMTYAQERALSRGFNHPNSCGQGDHPDAAGVPVVRAVIDAGWRYSHTTAITIEPGDRYELHHTFKRGDHAISFWIAHNGGWKWSGSWGSSGFHYTSRDLGDVARYLRGVARRAKKAGRECF